MGWVVNATSRPLCPRERPGTHCIRGLVGAPGSVWTGVENLAPTGIRSPYRPALSGSLYRLNYPDTHTHTHTHPHTHPHTHTHTHTGDSTHTYTGDSVNTPTHILVTQYIQTGVSVTTHTHTHTGDSVHTYW
jgi:hypothetical protein